MLLALRLQQLDCLMASVQGRLGCLHRWGSWQVVDCLRHAEQVLLLEMGLGLAAGTGSQVAVLLGKLRQSLAESWPETGTQATGPVWAV